MQGDRRAGVTLGKRWGSGLWCRYQVMSPCLPVPLLSSEGKCQAAQPEGNLIKTDKRKQLRMYSKSLAGGTRGREACLRMWI